ncbi:dihydroneopterin aldolase [Candidatus Margulisiibacteriota bacterium]
MLSEIKIENLKLSLIIGCQKQERKNKQTVIINLAYKYDCKKAVENDDITQAIDYKALSDKIILGIKDTKYVLIETLAKKILDIVESDKKIISAKVEVKKLKPMNYVDNVSTIMKKG